MANNHKPMRRSPNPMPYQHQYECFISSPSFLDYFSIDPTGETYNRCEAEACEGYHECTIDDIPSETAVPTRPQAPSRTWSAPPTQTANTSTPLMPANRTRSYGTVVTFADPLVTRIYTTGPSRSRNQPVQYQQEISKVVDKSRYRDVDLENGHVCPTGTGDRNTTCYESFPSYEPQISAQSERVGGMVPFQGILKQITPLVLFVMYLWVWWILDDGEKALVFRWSFFGAFSVTAFIYACYESWHFIRNKSHCQSTGGEHPVLQELCCLIGVAMFSTPVVWLFALMIRFRDPVETVYMIIMALVALLIYTFLRVMVEHF